MSEVNTKKLIHQLSVQGEKVIESECFSGLNYLIKDGQIVLIAGKNGTISIKFGKIETLYKELKEIRSVWAEINTGSCNVYTRSKDDEKRKVT